MPKGWPCKRRVTLLLLSPKRRSKSGEEFLRDESNVTEGEEKIKRFTCMASIS